MGLNIKEYWRSVRKIAASLDPEAARLDASEESDDLRVHLDMSAKEIWLVSLEHDKTGGRAGSVVSARPLIAAGWLKEGTHVLASEEQIAAHKAELLARKEVIEKEEADRKGVPTSKLLEALVAAQQPAAARRRAE